MNHLNANPSPQRAAILRAAEAVFAEKGFAGAGVDEIARRAGVNKAMLYYHVGDKARLYAEVVLSFLAEVEDEVTARLAAATTPVERLAGFHRALVAVAFRRPEYPRIMLRELAAGAANLPPEVTGRMVRLLGLTREIVATGVQGGQFRDVDPVLAHILLVGSVVFFANALRLRDRLTAQGADLPPLDGSEQAAAAITDILLNGIAVQPHQGDPR